MVAIRDHAAAPAGHLVQPPGHANAEALHRPTESDLIRGFDDEMNVVGLDREVDDPDAQPLARRAQCPPHRRIDPEAPQVRDAAQHPRRHVDRKARLEPRTAGVPHLGGRALRLASGASARPAPGAGEPELELARAAAPLFERGRDEVAMPGYRTEPPPRAPRRPAASGRGSCWRRRPRPAPADGRRRKRMFAVPTVRELAAPALARRGARRRVAARRQPRVGAAPERGARSRWTVDGGGVDSADNAEHRTQSSVRPSWRRAGPGRRGASGAESIRRTTRTPSAGCPAVMASCRARPSWRPSRAPSFASGELNRRTSWAPSSPRSFAGASFESADVAAPSSLPGSHHHAIRPAGRSTRIDTRGSRRRARPPRPSS